MPARTDNSGAILAIEPDSLAEEAGLQPGDRVLAVDGEPVRDAIDYRFKTTDSLVALDIARDGETATVEFEKPIDEPIGIEFTDDAFGGTEICNNKCFFCFLKGLPKGLRKPLYIKDDDYKLSFLHGNFVTLTNLEPDDWQRLREQRLSPLHVSVHATDLELRRELLGNPRAPDIRDQLRDLQDCGIQVHAQVVLCPGVNDGPHLDQTIGDLLQHPNVASIGVVPVGSSLEADARSAHPGMRRHSPAESRAAVARLRRWQRRARGERGATIVFPSDEFYLAAAARIPAARRYDGFPQWENGIGMVRTLIDDWRRLRRRIRAGRIDPEPLRSRPLVFACGALIAPTLTRLAAELSAETGARIEVRPVPNRLFGDRVNVSGLIPGADFADALAGLPPDSGIFLPRASLDYFGNRFLDDMTPAQLEQALARPIDRPVAFVYTLSDVLQSALAPDGPSFRSPLANSNGRAWSQPG